MILVNLLPPEFRKQTVQQGARWQSAKIIKVGAAVFILLTAIFYLRYLSSIGTVKSLRSRWLSVQSELQRVNREKSEMETSSKAERIFFEKYITSSYKAMAILSAISELLPNSTWLVELKITREPSKNTVIIKGISRATRNKSSVQEIEKYLRELKEKFPANTDLSLTTTREQKERAELTLFTAVFKWD